MSYAEDYGYDAYTREDVSAWRNRQNYPKNEEGIRQCKDCKSTNLKTSKAGNLYCGVLCWVEKEQS